MAKEILKDVTIRNAKATDKDQRLNDGEGLYIIIKSNGAKWWRFDYTFAGKRKTLSVGVYPATGLGDARRKAETTRAKVSNGIDPSNTRKETKVAQQVAKENESRLDAGLTIINSFEHIACEWGEKKVEKC
ncbi:Arm DNA-binding domain-containing protein [Methylobacter psychrophilus]|uniref:Arm DNA-binding domain-containing protein n=1 Tax=Methylobacter psychrophilus TaxID=96941 RepID=UPI0021D4DBFA|nr:Arm DNA-binding domain-containing protein [Methylobacter psychrophilus]